MSQCVCLCVAVNSPACHIWIVCVGNDITDCNTILFSVSGFCLLALNSLFWK